MQSLAARTVWAPPVVEVLVLPPMLVFLWHWFIRAERGRADAFLILGNLVPLMWMSVLSGYLVAAVDYRWMFAIEDLRAIGWAAPAPSAAPARRPRPHPGARPGQGDRDGG